MNLARKISKIALTFSVIAVTALSFAQSGKQISADEKKEVLAKVEQIITQFAYVPGADFKGWPKMVQDNEEKLSGADTDNEFANVVNELLGSYGYSHISLFTPEYGTARETQSRAGIGIRIQIEEEGVRVVAIFPKSPADKAGIKVGDLIFESDGKQVKGVAELLGEKGQSSKIKLKRGDEVKAFSITRDEYSTVIPETVEWHDTIAQVKIPTFDQGYSQDNVNKIMKEVSSKATGLILDLRGNGGGRVTNLQHLAGFFLDPRTQPMGTFLGKTQITAYERKNEPTKDLAKIAEATPFKVRALRKVDTPKLSVPVTVLIDGGTGSASEMMSAALKEHKGSTVIGSKSAGAVLASVIQPLRDKRGYWIQIPMLDYITIKGFRLEGNGVTPDIKTEPMVFGQPDQAILKAIETLKSTKKFDW